MYGAAAAGAPLRARAQHDADGALHDIVYSPRGRPRGARQRMGHFKQPTTARASAASLTLTSPVHLVKESEGRRKTWLLDVDEITTMATGISGVKMSTASAGACGISQAHTIPTPRPRTRWLADRPYAVQWTT